MSDLSIFLKENREKRNNEFFCPSEDFKDVDGNGVKWEIKPVSTREEEIIREESMELVEGRYRLNVSKYVEKMVVEAIVFPNLFDVSLQDSYGVRTPADLVKEILNKPGDYSRLAAFVQSMNGFKTMREDIEEAKN